MYISVVMMNINDFNCSQLHLIIVCAIWFFISTPIFTSNTPHYIVYHHQIYIQMQHKYWYNKYIWYCFLNDAKYCYIILSCLCHHLFNIITNILFNINSNISSYKYYSIQYCAITMLVIVIFNVNNDDIPSACKYWRETILMYYVLKNISYKCCPIQIYINADTIKP